MKGADMKVKIEALPLPICVIDKNKMIVDCNSNFTAEFESDKTDLNDVIDDIKFLSMVNDFIQFGEINLSFRMVINKKTYNISIAPEENNQFILFFDDINDLIIEEQTKERYLYDLIMDIYTPLTLIKGYAELLQNSLLTSISPDKLEFFRMIIDSSDDIAMKINSSVALLDMPQEETVVQRKETSIIAIVKHVLSRLEGSIQAKHLNIVSDSLGSKARAAIDVSRISQAIYNILHNAVKYSKPSGNIYIELEERENDVVVSIEDSGEGVPEDDVQNIFAKFYRGATEENKTQPSAGVGLYIAMLFITQNNGVIWVDEPQHGHGLKIKFLLPKK